MQAHRPPQSRLMRSQAVNASGQSVYSRQRRNSSVIRIDFLGKGSPEGFDPQPARTRKRPLTLNARSVAWEKLAKLVTSVTLPTLGLIA